VLPPANACCQVPVLVQFPFFPVIGSPRFGIPNGATSTFRDEEDFTVLVLRLRATQCLFKAVPISSPTDSLPPPSLLASRVTLVPSLLRVSFFPHPAIHSLSPNEIAAITPRFFSRTLPLSTKSRITPRVYQKSFKAFPFLVPSLPGSFPESCLDLSLIAARHFCLPPFEHFLRRVLVPPVNFLPMLFPSLEFSLVSLTRPGASERPRQV